jgi:hypothetical protein
LQEALETVVDFETNDHIEGVVPLRYGDEVIRDSARQSRDIGRRASKEFRLEEASKKRMNLVAAVVVLENAQTGRRLDGIRRRVAEKDSGEGRRDEWRDTKFAGGHLDVSGRLLVKLLSEVLIELWRKALYRR